MKKLEQSLWFMWVGFFLVSAITLNSTLLDWMMYSTYPIGVYYATKSIFDL